MNPVEEASPLDPDAAALLATLAAAEGPGYEQLYPAQARLKYNAARAASQASAPITGVDVRDICVEGPHLPIPVRVYRPTDIDHPLPVLVYFHGGGWVLGGLDAFDRLCRKFAVRGECVVFSVDYRLAPEHRFPAQIDDAWAATQTIARIAKDHGGDAARLAVGGDSAGGTLAATVAILARDAGAPDIRAQMLLYPVLDASCNHPSHHELATGHVLTATLLEWFQNHYFGPSGDRSDWRASPLRAKDLHGLPSAIVVTASHDPLRDEGEAYAARLKAAGVATTSWRVPGQIHGFLVMDGLMRVADPTVSWLCTLLRDAWGAPRT